MDDQTRKTSSVMPWWLTLGAFVVYLLLPGASRSPFSGIPFSSKAHLIVGSVLILSMLTLLFPPLQRMRWTSVWLLFAACLLKTLLFPLMIAQGWQASYWTAQVTSPPSKILHRVQFHLRGVRDYRIDRQIAFEGVNFGLHYVNDWPWNNAVLTKEKRDVAQPLMVRWTGFLTSGATPSSSSLLLSARGHVRVAVDGTQVFDRANPLSAVLHLSKDSEKAQRISIEYFKRAGEKPAITVTTSSVVTPRPVPERSLVRSRWASRAVDGLGIFALALLVIMFLQAYGRPSRFFLEHIWRAPDRVAVIAFFAAFVLMGVARAIPNRHASLPISFGDDPLAYEGGARLILHNGLLMTDGTVAAGPYYFYPLYSYALAAAHALFGEDFGTIIFFNYLCLAFLGLLAWCLLRNHLLPGSIIGALVLIALFVNAHLIPYAKTAFSDNLFVPLVFLVIITCDAALRRKSTLLLFLCGVLTALGAATRPSLLFFLPFFVIGLLFFWKSVKLLPRLGAATVFSLGFAAGLAPFTIRNWIVSSRFVPLISSYIMLPIFLFLPGENFPTDLVARAATAGGAIQAFLEIFASAPGHYLWIEIRKILYTLGFPRVGPPGISPPIYFLIFPLLSVTAIWARRIPRPLKQVLIVFFLSHVTAMVVAAPWIYAYKTILPFHLVSLVGAAFLLPKMGDALVQQAIIPKRIDGRQRTVSVVLPTYNEKDSIREVILDFFGTGAVNEVIVVNNNAVEGTSEEVAGTGAREVYESRQGYGAATRRGLLEAKGDLIVICEPDGTFLARDMKKLLAFADDFDVVYGSRTSQQLVWQGANMGHFLRWGNWVVAKYMEFLFNATSLTDVGCTYRLIRRQVAEELRDSFRIEGSQFGPEMMVLSLRHGYRVIQVPVNYLPRVGESSVTGDPAKAFRLGLQMIWLITSHRVREAFSRPDLDEAIPSHASSFHA